MNDGGGLRWSQVAAIALVVGLLSWLGWRLYLNAGHLLGPSSWVSPVLLVAMAVLVVSAGLPVRRFLRGEARKPLSPIRAARTLVLAQAAALTGSALVGWYAAQALHALADLSLPDYRTLLWQQLAECAAAVLLAGAGMATQRMCRVERPPRDDDRDD